MDAIVDLNQLLALAAPHLAAGEFVFVSLPKDYPTAPLAPLCTFEETEGLSVIVDRQRAAQAGFPIVRAFRQITLTVNSSLEAVGFLAAIAGALAGAGIPCNAVSAFHHDHIFVPVEDAERAMTVLSQLGGDAGPDTLDGLGRSTAPNLSRRPTR